MIDNPFLLLISNPDFITISQKILIFNPNSKIINPFLEMWILKTNNSNNNNNINKVILRTAIPCNLQSKSGFNYREPETQWNARLFGSSMTGWQRFGCLDTWPCNCKQTSSLRFPIALHKLPFNVKSDTTSYIRIKNYSGKNRFSKL